MEVLTVAKGTEAFPFISLPGGTLGPVYCVQGYGAGRNVVGLRVKKEGPEWGLLQQSCGEELLGWPWGRWALGHMEQGRG